MLSFASTLQQDAFTVYEDSDSEVTNSTRVTRSRATQSQQVQQDESAAELSEDNTLDKENQATATEILAAITTAVEANEAAQQAKQATNKGPTRRKARKPFQDVTTLYMRQFAEGGADEEDMAACLASLSIQDSSSAACSSNQSSSLPPAKSSKSSAQSSPTSYVKTYRFSMAEAVKSIR